MTADRDFERAQVDLAQRPLIDVRADEVAVCFLIVGSEMLQASADAFGLKSLNHRAGEATGEQRILRVVLEVSSAQRAALDIDSRSKDDVD